MKLISCLPALVLLAACEKVDTQTRVLARNVIVESSQRSALTAGDAQGALEELTLDLPRVMVGTWTIVNKNIESEHAATGRVRIDAGGTFALLAGSFAAAGEGTGGFCDHVAGSEHYEFLTPKLVVFKHVNQTTPNNVIPTLVDLQSDSITFLGSGGCGQLGLQRVSILTREAATDAGQP